MQNNNVDTVRLDKWLWASRFFKTRSQASDAVSGGHVHLNQKRVKPAHKLKVGDKLVINKNEMDFNIVVLGLSDKRLGAKLAVLLYEEDEQSKINRLEKLEQRKLNRQENRNFSRSDKKQKRQIRQFKQKIGD